jgi:hypothetical protein
VLENGKRSTLSTKPFEYEKCKFVVADVDESGVILATEATAGSEGLGGDTDDVGGFKKGKGSTVYYRAFSRRGEHEDGEPSGDTFFLTLPAGETVVGVALGRSWIAVATSTNLVRIFSCTGVQLAVTRAAGPVVCITGADQQLAVFYHRGGPVEGTESLGVDLLCIGDDDKSPPRAFATTTAHLGAGSRVKWVGFDRESGILTMMDTGGTLSALVKSAGWQWMPVLDRSQMLQSLSSASAAAVSATTATATAAPAAAATIDDDELWPLAVKSEKLFFVVRKAGHTAPCCRAPPIVQSLPFIPATCVGAEGAAERTLWEAAKARHFKALLDDHDSFGEGESFPHSYGLEARSAAQCLVADRAVLSLIKNACRGRPVRVAQATDLIARLSTSEWAAKAAKLFALYAQSRTAPKDGDQVFQESMVTLKGLAEATAERREQKEIKEAQERNGEALGGYGVAHKTPSATAKQLWVAQSGPAGVTTASPPRVGGLDGTREVHGLRDPAVERLVQSSSRVGAGVGAGAGRKAAGGDDSAAAGDAGDAGPKRFNPFKKKAHSPHKKRAVSVFQGIQELKGSPGGQRKKRLR